MHPTALPGPLPHLTSHPCTHRPPLQLFQKVQALAPLDARIWVLLCDDIAGVHNFWTIAKPILSINTYFMGISDLAKPGLYQNTGQPPEFISLINWGFLGFQHAVNDWKVTAAGKDFIDRLKRMDATASYDANGKVKTCSQMTDSTGVKMFNITVGGSGSGTSVCAGMEYSKVRPI